MENKTEKLPPAYSLQEIAREVVIPLNATEEVREARRKEGGFFVIEEPNISDPNMEASDMYKTEMRAEGERWLNDGNNFRKLLVLIAREDPILDECKFTDEQQRIALYAGSSVEMAVYKTFAFDNQLSDRTWILNQFGLKTDFSRTTIDEAKAKIAGLDRFQQKLQATAGPAATPTI